MREEVGDGLMARSSGTLRVGSPQYILTNSYHYEKSQMQINASLTIFCSDRY